MGDCATDARLAGLWSPWTGNPMRLTRRVCENFRCFEKLAMDLHPEFTLLVGANGSEKSAVLNAIVGALCA